mgnify:CR=1 FL=1
MAEKAPKKTHSEMLAEYATYRKWPNRNYIHTGSGESYYLLNLAFDVNTQELTAVYSFNAMPQFKFTRPMSEFVEKFTEGHSAH